MKTKNIILSTVLLTFAVFAANGQWEPLCLKGKPQEKGALFLGIKDGTLKTVNKKEDAVLVDITEKEHFTYDTRLMPNNIEDICVVTIEVKDKGFLACKSGELYFSVTENDETKWLRETTSTGTSYTPYPPTNNGSSLLIILDPNQRPW